MCDCLAKGDVPQLEVNFRRQEQYGDEFAMGLLKEEPLAGDQAAFPGAKEDEAYAFAGGAWPRRDCPEVGPRAPPELREAAPSLEAEGSREAPRPPEGRERCGREGPPDAAAEPLAPSAEPPSAEGDARGRTPHDLRRGGAATFGHGGAPLAAPPAPPSRAGGVSVQIQEVRVDFDSFCLCSLLAARVVSRLPAVFSANLWLFGAVS
ncbi:unnamed protein product [Prorocentrum cordatum]|uniref:Uncharacterized protein n=1 Tax=Prorocentrum cordatum TaxID=2364126 RepID=A0ABN9QGX2_9DINO|nr:unnamed protein product [Polarella glacialis]